MPSMLKLEHRVRRFARFGVLADVVCLNAVVRVLAGQQPLERAEQAALARAVFPRMATSPRVNSHTRCR
jgi:hypothetical protein